MSTAIKNKNILKIEKDTKIRLRVRDINKNKK